MTYNNEGGTSLDSWFPAFDPLTDTPTSPAATAPVSGPEPTTVDAPASNDGSHWLTAPTPTTPAPPQRTSRRRVGTRTVCLTVATAAATAGGAAIAAWALTSEPGNAPAAAAVTSIATPVSSPSVATTPEPTSAAAQPWCRESVTDGVVTGAGPGDTSSGSAAILAFEHAYYVLRSGAAAREILAPNAQLKSATAEELQRGIDTIPVGTEHCVTIRAAAPNTYAVTLEQRYNDGTRAADKQTISTTDAGGRTFITSIGAAQ